MIREASGRPARYGLPRQSCESEGQASGLQISTGRWFVVRRLFCPLAVAGSTVDDRRVKV